MNYNKDEIIRKLLLDTIYNKLNWIRYDQKHLQETFVTHLNITEKKSVRVSLTKSITYNDNINFFMYFHYKTKLIKSIYYSINNELFKLFATVKYRYYLNSKIGVDNFLKEIVNSGVKWEPMNIFDNIIGYKFTMLGKSNNLKQNLEVIIHEDRFMILYNNETITFKKIDDRYFNAINSSV